MRRNYEKNYGIIFLLIFSAVMALIAYCMVPYWPS